METTATLQIPVEVLLSSHLTAERLVERAKLEAALALYREGNISSGLAASWVGEPRVSFLLRAQAAGIALLTDSNDDFNRECSLLL